MHPIPQSTDLALRVMLEPRRIVRWTHVGRLVVATAIFVAAAFAWPIASRADALVAALAFVAAVAWTGWALVRSEVRRRAPGRVFLAAQAAVDLLLTTAIVHVTGGGASQFAALYLLVIAASALLLPFGLGVCAAALGSALYTLDVAVLRPSGGGLELWLQLGVFVAVALGSGYMSARLREAGAGGERLAAALARARVEAADILRNIRSGIVTVDAEGRLLYANPAASALLGVDLAERVGRPVLAEIGRHAPELAHVLERAAARGERTTRAEGTIAPGGATIGVTTTVSDARDERHEGADADGVEAARATGTAIFSDITESKRLAALHLRAERLEAVAELSASLAHEIKNPLASIRSAVEQLARLTAACAAGATPVLDAEDAADVRSLAGLTVRESDRLSHLLSEFLDFARARVTRVERVDVRAVAREAAAVAQAHPAAAGVRVVVEAPGGPGSAATVDGDGELLHRALFNLVLNAVQASAQHASAQPEPAQHTLALGSPGRAESRVRVEVQLPDGAELPAGLAFAHGAVAVHVSDDGAGIAPDLLGRLFEPFVTTKPQGSGLGLAVVQRAVEAHRGVVLVEGGGAGTGTGARFTVLLPRAAADAEPALAAVRPYLRTPAASHRAVA